MRFLANENFPMDVVEALRSAGHDVAWMRTDAPGSTDEEVLDRATTEGRVLLTFDKDFGDLAFHTGLPATCGIVLFRLTGSTPPVLAARIVAALESRGDWVNVFGVVERGRVRIRPLTAPP